MSETLAPPVAAPPPATVAAPVVAPVVAPTPAPAEPAQAVQPVPAPAQAAEPAPTSVLGEALIVPPVVPPPAEAAPVAPAEPANPEGQSAEPAPPPAYDPFALPEGVTLDTERAAAFTGLLGEFETKTKADHAEMQGLGQKLLDTHIAEVTRVVSDIEQAAKAQFESTKTAWKDAFLADPEIGGNRFQTTVDSARQFIRTHGGTDAQQAEFAALMDQSGLGNHPAMIRLLARAGAAMSEGRPLAAASPQPAQLSKTQKLYGGR